MSEKSKNYQIDSPDDLLGIIRLVFSDINVGLLIYHAEDLENESKLKLIFANQEASAYTHADLNTRVGKYIFDAFPALRQTELPKDFIEVAKSKNARKIGVVEYSDDEMEEGTFSVKAFPLPAECVGVVFEDIALRKRVDKLVKKHTDELRGEYEGMESKIEQTTESLDEIISNIQLFRQHHDDTLSKEADNRLGNITGMLQDLFKLLKGE